MVDFESLGKFLSLILRHKPETIECQLDENGYISVDTLIEKVNSLSSYYLDDDILKSLVENNSKKRYEYNHDRTKIRARQGHSLPVDVELLEKRPPKTLYHGTTERFLESIRDKGILKMSRQYVHLSETIETAITVGERHGKPHVLTIDAEGLFLDGQKFYLSRNGVWLTDDIAQKYIKDL